MDNAVAAFVLAAIVGLVLAGLAFWLATKSGLQPAQAALINTLKDNGEALEKQVGRLESELEVQKKRRMALERKVSRLEAAVLQLAQENAELRKKGGFQPTQPSMTAAGIDDEGGE